jgi:hypothetical protein
MGERTDRDKINPGLGDSSDGGFMDASAGLGLTTAGDASQ